jgi:ribosomal protein L16 Arg81 hydroxylase
LLEAIPHDMEFEKESSPLLRCDLIAGDWLYVPAGYWHVARADEDSLSISIGVAAPTAMDLFDELRSLFAESAAWRRRLHPHGLHQEMAGGLGDAARRILLDSTALEGAIERVRRKHAQRHASQTGTGPAFR